MLDRIAAPRLVPARRAMVPPFHVMNVLAAAKERQRTHGDLVSLAAGQPSSPAPGPVLAAATRFQVTVEMLEELAEPVRGLVVASPANPTGTLLAPDELAALDRWCAEHGVQLVSDEIYHGISYGTPTASAWQTTTESIVV